VGSDESSIPGLLKGDNGMARKSAAEGEDRSGVVVGTDERGYRADLGSSSQNRGDASEPDLAEGEILERPVSDQLDDNGRGDGSEYYDNLRTVITRVREPWGLPDDEGRKKFPKLMASLTDRQTPKGKSREGARISLAATKTGFRVTLSDYLISMKLTVDVDHLEDIFQALEDGISRRRGFWQDMKAGEAYNRKKSDEAKRLGNSDGIS
jgi:hypothetical protein